MIQETWVYKTGFIDSSCHTKNAIVLKHTFSHPFATCILKKIIRFLPISPVINRRPFDQFGDNLGVFWLRDVLKYTQTKCRTGSTSLWGVWLHHAKNILRNLGSGSEEYIYIRPFVFRSKPVSMEEYDGEQWWVKPFPSQSDLHWKIVHLRKCLNLHLIQHIRFQYLSYC